MSFSATGFSFWEGKKKGGLGGGNGGKETAHVRLTPASWCNKIVVMIVWSLLLSPPPPQPSPPPHPAPGPGNTLKMRNKSECFHPLSKSLRRRWSFQLQLQELAQSSLHSGTRVLKMTRQMEDKYIILCLSSLLFQNCCYQNYVNKKQNRTPLPPKRKRGLGGGGARDCLFALILFLNGEDISAKADLRICRCYSTTNNQDIHSQILWEREREGGGGGESF